ncbi:hypothetical protein HYV89_01280 [Candidatus Woesearchaeota archaeon]|nr:hypothetical protein [Candidatus Woesearchaeota archaeon]
MGLVLAVIFGFTGSQSMNWLLVLLGLVVGFLNITEKEVITFLVAAIALMSAGSANLTALGQLGSVFGSILQSVVVFVAPAAVVVAVKAVYGTGR